MNDLTMRNALQFVPLLTLYTAMVRSWSVAIAPASSPSVPPDGLYCSDRYGNLVEDGVVYMPEDDPCKKCQCQTGFPVMCLSVLCSPPACEKFESSKNVCCEFRCLQPSLDVHRNHGNGSKINYTIHKDLNSVNLSIRLVASAVTSLLIIALLIFMIHRLRQRRLLITMRRLNNERRSVNESMAYMTNIDQLDVGFEFPPYEDPPPPYSPPKPLHDFPNDDPPPYELTIPIPLEAGDDGNSSVRETVSGQSVPFSIMGIRRSGNAAWTREHLLRPYSAEEYSDPELIELTRLNHQSKSIVAVSSPILTRCGGSMPNSCTISDSSGGNLETYRCNSDVCSTEDRCLSIAHQASDRSLVNQLKFDSSDSQLLHNRAACSSPLKSSTELDGVEPDKWQKQSENQQHSLCHADVHWSTPLKANTECLKRFETLSDPISNQFGSLPADPEGGNYQNKTRVKQLCYCNTMMAGGSVIQKSASGLKQCYLSCSSPCREETLQSFGRTRSAVSKSKPSLFSGSLLKKKKQKTQRPLSCIEPMSDAVTNVSMLDSLQALSLTDEHYEAKAKNRTVEGYEKPTNATVHQFTSPSLCSCISSSIHMPLYKTRADEKVNEDPQDVDSASAAMKQSVKKNTAKLVGSGNYGGSVQPPSPGSVLTPESPTHQQFLRSESVTSEASFFSICSETGENKHTKSSTLSSTQNTTTPKNSASNGVAFRQLSRSWIGNIRQPVVAMNIELGYLPDEASTLGLTSSVATESLKRNSSSNWIFKQEHFVGKNHCTLPGKKKQEKRKSSVDYPNTLPDSWSTLQSKICKEQSSQKPFEGFHFDRQSHPQYYEQNKANNLGLASSHAKHSCTNTCKEHTSSGHKCKSKQLESFERLVSRILQQLETAYFDDFGIHTAAVQKIRRPQSFEHQSSRHSVDRICVPGKSTRNQMSRPIGARNRFLSDDTIKSKLAVLDIANKNGRTADTCEMMNDNKCLHISCSDGGQVSNYFEEPHTDL